MRGDASVIGWLTVVAYGVAAVLALRATFRSRSGLAPPPGRPAKPDLPPTPSGALRAPKPRCAKLRPTERLRVFWGLSAMGLAALGANKQLDLQIDLMRATKALATELGLYPDHRQALILTAGVLALVAFAAGVLFVLRLLKAHLRTMVPAIVGWALVLAYVAVRAAFFHHLDEVGFGFVAWTGAVALELLGIVLLGYAALQRPEEVSSEP